MVLIDANIIIYIGKAKLPIDTFDSMPFAYSTIARIESLGFHDLPVSEARAIESFLELGTELPMTPATTEHAIRYRQMKKMSLGDAIIAATATEHGLELWTTNDKDFAHISDITTYKPRLNP